jgi:hypothetical protein
MLDTFYPISRSCLSHTPGALCIASKTNANSSQPSRGPGPPILQGSHGLATWGRAKVLRLSATAMLDTLFKGSLFIPAQ